jgi:hypothetical protein
LKRRLFLKTTYFVLGLAGKQHMRKPSNKLRINRTTKKKIKPFLNRDQSYFLQAIIKIEFDDYYNIHKNNVDVHTHISLQMLVNDLIKYYTIYEEKEK